MKHPLPRILARSATGLPEPARRWLMIRHLHFDPQEVRHVVFKLAESRAEREQAFHLLHDCYERRGLIEHTASGLRVSLHALLPTTATFVGMRNDAVQATLSLIEDSPFGLPMESLYATEISSLRANGRHLAEVGALAVAPSFRRKGVTLMMFNLMIRWAYFRGVEDLVITVHPRSAAFYRTLLLFERIGDVRVYASLRDAPAVALRLDLTTTFARYARTYGSSVTRLDSNDRLNLHRFFHLDEFPNLCLPPWRRMADPGCGPEDVRHFAAQNALDLEALTEAQRDYLFARQEEVSISALPASPITADRDVERVGTRE